MGSERANRPVAQSPGTASVWTRPAISRPTRKPHLTRALILDEAVRLLDRDGIEAFSMRALAEHLGSGTMSLYYHVPTRDEVLELVLDRVLGEIDTASWAASDWPDAVRALAMGLRATLRRHPWSAPLLGSHPSIGAHGLAATEALVAALDRAGLTPARLDAAFTAIYSFVVGFATIESAWEASLRRAGLDEAGWLAQVGPYLEEATMDRHPALAAYLRGGFAIPPEDRFEAALEQIIRGLVSAEDVCVDREVPRGQSG
jgi:AcrR family transcriptional regulator